MGALEISSMLRAFLFILLAGICPALPAATLMVLGDSISAGYGLPQGTGWVALLQQRLEREKFDYKVVNASLTGETTGGALKRAAFVLAQHKPKVVVVELGGNDGLRGTRVETIRSNLAAIIGDCRAHGAKVLLVGMQLPSNYGTDYARKFRAMYSAVARSQRVPLVPFLFEGFAADRDAFQPDGIHPAQPAQSRMLENIWPRLKPLLRKR